MTFLLSIRFDEYITPEQVWPDGDGPENPTEADVAAVIADSSSVGRFLSEWNLHPVIFVDSTEVVL